MHGVIETRHPPIDSRVIEDWRENLKSVVEVGHSFFAFVLVVAADFLDEVFGAEDASPVASDDIGR